MDIFIERIVARRKKPQDHLITAAIIFGVIIALLVIPAIPMIGGLWPILAAGLIYVGYLFITSRNIEFEYAVTNGDLDIDKIISQRKRKRIFSSSCKEFEVVAKLGSDKYTHDIRSIKNRIDATSFIDSPNVYFAALKYKGERTVVFFEPDKKMLDAFKTFIPRKVFE